MGREIILINGSPRRNKNSYMIVSKVREVLESNNIKVNQFNVYDMNIEYCTGCGFCEKTGYCKIKDEMTPMYEIFDKNDGCIVVSPIHFDCISAKVKTLVDRTQAFFSSKYVLKKPSIDRDKKRIGMFVAVGGAKPYETQFIGGQLVMNLFYKSINTNLEYNLYLNNTDDVNASNNPIFIQELDNKLNNYINDIKNI